VAGTWRQRARAAAFLGPAIALIAVWIVYPTVWTVVRSLFDRSGDGFVGLANYRTLVTSDTLVKAIQNNALWLLVVPAAVTAIGLVLAVLTERIRWSVAFRTVVFMPMAISMFAAGVIWHVMDDHDPERGAVNAAVQVVRGAVSGAGVLSDARASTPRVSGTPEKGFAAAAVVRPGESTSIGLTAIPTGELPADADQARTPPSRPGAITGTVWRDFKPGGGRPGVVEPQERGVPGATVELRNAGGKTVASTKTERDGGFRFEDVAGGAFDVVLWARTVADGDRGIGWLGPRESTPAL
jgi:alpha-glucoside transport system permease protein